MKGSAQLLVLPLHFTRHVHKYTVSNTERGFSRLLVIIAFLLFLGGLNVSPSSFPGTYKMRYKGSLVVIEVNCVHRSWLCQHALGRKTRISTEQKEERGLFGALFGTYAVALAGSGSGVFSFFSSWETLSRRFNVSDSNPALRSAIQSWARVFSSSTSCCSLSRAFWCSARSASSALCLSSSACNAALLSSCSRPALCSLTVSRSERASSATTRSCRISSSFRASSWVSVLSSSSDPGRSKINPCGAASLLYRPPQLRYQKIAYHELNLLVVVSSRTVE